MTCTRGCCPTPADHYRTVRVASSGRRALTKTTTDDHGTHSVDVVEHWHDRQDVQVRGPRTVRARLSRSTGEMEQAND